MESKEIENEMNSLMERLAKRPAVSSEPYSADPLASDHFILQRSWDFFKKRISAIEKQWQDILNAKTEELRVVKKELDLRYERLHELEELNSSLEGMLANFKLSRLQDFEQFKKKNEKLKLAWEEERVSLESKMMTLEFEVDKARRKTEEETKRALGKMEILQKTIEALRKENQDLVGRHAASQQSLEKILRDKDEAFQTSEAKADLLRREVERRDQIIHELDGKIKEGEQASRLARTELENFLGSMHQKEEDIKALGLQKESFLKEKANLLESWDREKAEWRELWERSREIWEKKKI